jgi:hypothetical protein
MGWILGLGNGVVFRQGGGSGLGSSYWKTHLFNEDDLSLWVKSRDDKSLIDTINVSNSPIILPSAYLNGGGYVYGDKTRTEEHIFDGDDHTIFFEITQILAVPTTSTFPFITLGASSTNTRGIFFMLTGQKIRCYFGDGTVTQLRVDPLSGLGTIKATMRYCLITVNFTTKKLDVAFLDADGNSVNDTALSVDISSFTFNTDDNYASYSFSSSHFAVGNFKKFIGIKTLEQCLTDSYVTGLQLHYPTLQSFADLVSGKHLSGNNFVETNNIAYGYHTDWLLKYGYDLYSVNKTGNETLAGYNDFFIPHDVEGNSIAWSLANYVFIKSVPGSLTTHNNSDSKIRFVNDFFDRSNTTIWSDLARDTDYDSVNPKDFHISKLNQRTIYQWLNNGYKGRFFIKCTGNSIEDGSENCLKKGTRGNLLELILYNTDVKGVDNKKVLTYTNDIIASVLDIHGNPSYDNNNYIKIGTLKTTKPLMTVRIDDWMANEGLWETVMDDFGIVAEIGCLVGRNVDPTLNYWGLPFSELVRLQGKGWEILSHGMDDDDLSGQDVSVAEEEIPESLAILQSHGISARNFCPHKYGQQAMWVRRIASEYFESCQGYKINTTDLLPSVNVSSPDIWNLSSIRLDIAGDYMVTTEEGKVLVKEAIDLAFSENRWISVFFHNLTAELEAGVREIIQYGVTKGMTFVTTQGALDDRKYL